MVFALPGEPGLSELCGDFKVQFHDRQGDFYCWLNTTFMENRKILNTTELDGFDKRKLPSPGFQVEIVLADYDGSRLNAAETSTKNQNAGSPQSAPAHPSSTDGNAASVAQKSKEESSDNNNDKDDLFSDEEGGGGSSKGGNKSSAASPVTTATTTTTLGDSNNPSVGGGSVDKMTEATQNLSIENVGGGSKKTEAVPLSSKSGVSELTTPDSQFKAMAADASVFTFGDEDDYESE